MCYHSPTPNHGLIDCPRAPGWGRLAVSTAHYGDNLMKGSREGGTPGGKTEMCADIDRKCVPSL